MDILKTSTDWAKAEIFSSSFFILFGMMFIAASIGFWQLGKTELAKAFISPMFIAGTFLLIAGLGLVYTNNSRVNSFTTHYNNDISAFVQSEIIRVEKTENEYKNIAFKIFPMIVIISALFIIFTDNLMVRTISITTIATMVVIFFVDGNAWARIENYKKTLLEIQAQYSLQIDKKE